MKKWLHSILFILQKIKTQLKHSPITVEYPFVTKPIFNFSRVKIKNRFEECTGCGDCEKLCPVNAIKIEGDFYSTYSKKAKTLSGNDIVREMTSFQISYDTCIFCGICVTKCPTSSLHFDKEFVIGASETRLLVHNLMKEPKSPVKGSFI
jgi:formate hydrogenlyase subunit 6/NADH:ubiquinone oxidoreductase subunit I